MKIAWIAACCALLLCSFNAFSQNPADELDSLRKQEEEGVDTVIFNSKYTRYTNLSLLKDSTRTLPIDTSLRNLQLYSPLYQRHRPTIGLGAPGLAAREMLFNPRKNIGFDAGFHALDIYLLTQDSLRYYRARSPYTQLYYVNGQLKEQVFKVTHSQNIKPNWNFGANYFRLGSDGFYNNQQADHLNAAVFTWYESKNKRYNLLLNGLFNTLKATENGSVINDSLFNANTLARDALKVRLSAGKSNRTRQTWKHKNVFLKQFYYIGRIDSLASDSLSKNVLPTQRITHSLSYSDNSYSFFKNELDQYNAFPHVFADSALAADSTRVKHLANEFGYSFYLRGRAVTFIRNELKLDLRLAHDLYNYYQNDYHTSFQNVTAKAGLGYRFSDRVNIEGNAEQIFQGRDIGDFLYEANTNFFLGKNVGRVILGVYTQNKSPEQLFTRTHYTYHNWDLDFKNTKINNLSFTYQNPRYAFSARAEYYLMLNYLYLQEGAVAGQVVPEQFDNNINLLKISIDKNFRLNKFNLETSVVYQKTDFSSILRTPEVYTYNSLYYGSRWFKKLDINIGFDVWYNTPFKAPAYAININQFYNDRAGVEFDTYPVVDVWVKATLDRTNLFVKYDYANQDLFSKGFYTVNRYPMQDALLKFGVRWNFYD